MNIKNMISVLPKQTSWNIDYLLPNFFNHNRYRIGDEVLYDNVGKFLYGFD